MKRIAFKDLTNKSNEMELKRKTEFSFNFNINLEEQENIINNKVKRLRLTDEFSSLFTETSNCLLTRLNKTNINEDTSDSGIGTETTAQSTLDIFENLSDFEDEPEIEFKISKNKFLDLSNCSSNSMSPFNAARRCLFKQSPTPCSQKLNLSTPNRVLLNSDSIKINQEHNKPITPISSFKHSSIITTNDNLNYSFEAQVSLSTKQMNLEINQIQDDEENSNLKDIHNMIMQSLDYECSAHNSSHNQIEKRLIGDRSTYHLLPCISTVKHSDLNVITPSTFRKVLDGVYNTEIGKLVIIDARYPYEYDGGHIRNARNVYTKEKLIELFLDNRESLVKDLQPGKRLIVVFHCEFSSERGPSLLRFLRNQDRLVNKDSYPKLFYPELYLLEGGYKAFYEKTRDYCEPKMYKPMLHEDHVQDLKHFRSKAKTWEIQHKQIGSVTGTSFKSVTRTRLISSNTSRFQRFQSNLF